MQETSEAEPYDVCLVDKTIRGEPSAPKRWAPAAFVAPCQLQEYWAGLESAGFVPTTSTAQQRASTQCLTHKENSVGAKKTCRRGGWLYACTPTGYILHLKEYIGAESLSQRYFFLSELVHVAPDLNLVVHDDSCHLRKFCDTYAGSSAAARRLAFPNIKYVIDRLHSRGHVDPWCLENCVAGAACNQALLEGVNTSICEQAFSRLGRHKFAIRWMDRLTSAMFLNEMAEVRNQHWLAKL